MSPPGTYARFFDPMPLYWLDNERISLFVNSDEECAERCIEHTDFDCYAFGTEASGEERRCLLADANANATASDPGTPSPDDTRMYYRLLKPNSCE